ncbi:FAD-dependent oxidoreductase [Methanothermococcus okinawensis]|uniref:Amine oxidase n=1 Tax=Methanothermococcus okinawensis (strain DSM 14208 / JCM 11175 / IH1) TaxID=647113 RepID=F8AJL2_METOI|nr:FAD-dependent oxidoreductase [Methanothermococcus okinawensis]AEH07198.1 amine oxidase [Methanothermococcus okinawensis IH1]
MKIVVVGGGTSGLLSALALEKKGHDVVVLEKDKVGGLCRSEYIDGYTVDIGIHAITMLNDGPLIRLLKKYSRYLPNFRPYGDYYIRTDKLYNIPVSMQEWTTTPVVPNKDKILITTKIIDLMTSGFSKETSVYDIIKDMNLSKTSIDFFNTICYFLSGEDAKKTPLWRLFTGAGYIPEDDILPFIYKDLKINPLKTVLFKKFSRNKIMDILNAGFLSSIKSGSKKYINKFINKNRYWTQGYPLGGVQSICNCILYSLTKTDIRNEEVKRIIETSSETNSNSNDNSNNNSNNNNNHKNGYIVETDKNSYYADIVIYSAPSRYLPDIAQIPEIQKNKKDFKNIKFTKSLTVWIGHEENPFPYMGSEVWIDYPCWATCTSNYDKSLAPNGKHLLGFSFTNTKKEEVLNIIENKLGLNLNKADMIHFQEAIPEQASCAVNQFFVYPKVKDNFYVVGTDADPRSMGITRAAYSVEVMLSELDNTFNKNNKNK